MCAGSSRKAEQRGRELRCVMRTSGVRPRRLAIAGLVASAIAMSHGKAVADTLEWALVQAYQNNPSLNAQRAALRATDENVPQALSGYRPEALRHRQWRRQLHRRADAHLRGQRHQYRRRVTSARRQHALRFARRCRDRDADTVQRVADGQPRAPSGKPGHGRARDTARHRAASLAGCRDRIHEFAARRGNSRTQSAQRRSPDRAAEADPRPAQRRRGHAHRRGASGISPRCRPIVAAWRAVELRDVNGELSARDRRRARQAHARHACRPFRAPPDECRHFAGSAAESVGPRRDVRRRHCRTRGEDQRRFALPEPGAECDRIGELLILFTTPTSSSLGRSAAC